MMINEERQKDTPRPSNLIKTIYSDWLAADLPVCKASSWPLISMRSALCSRKDCRLQWYTGALKQVHGDALGTRCLQGTPAHCWSLNIVMQSIKQT